VPGPGGAAPMTGATRGIGKLPLLCMRP
jgi:hypothetical protein